MTIRNSYIIIFLLCIATLGGCKEEYVYPSVTTEFCDINSDPTGKLTVLTTDKGQLLHITDRKGIDGFAKDSTYRCVAKFTVPEKDGSIFLYSLFPTISNRPVPVEEFLEKNENGIQRDPVTLQRIWGTERYINMILLQKRKNTPHLYHLISEGMQTDKDGIKTETIILYHNRMDDYEAFDGEVYVSIPLEQYRNMNNGDRIQVKISTYKNRDEIRTFVKRDNNWILTD